jgi:hypothetical protein
MSQVCLTRIYTLEQYHKLADVREMKLLGMSSYLDPRYVEVSRRSAPFLAVS